MERKQNRDLQLVALGGFEKDGDLFGLKEGLFVLHKLGKAHLRDAQLFVVQRGGDERPAVQDGLRREFLRFLIDGTLAGGIGQFGEPQRGKLLEVVLPVGLVIQDRRGGRGWALYEADVFVDQAAQRLAAQLCGFGFFQYADLEFQRQIFDDIRIVSGECLADAADHNAAAVRARRQKLCFGNFNLFHKSSLHKAPRL